MSPGACQQKELTLDTILGKCEEFCKPLSNEVRAHFDLLTSFRQGNKSVDKLVQCSASTSQSSKIPPRNIQNHAQRYFWFFL